MTILGDLVSGKKFADIGCDHGYLLLYLLENNKIDFGIGCDINEKPLLNAKKNVISQGYDSKVSLYLADGLKNVDEDFDTLVVAGMGGSLIKQILSNSLDKISGKELVLQPNNNAKILRRFLQENNFKIVEDFVMEENSKYYEVLKVIPGQQNWTDFEIEFGKFNLNNQSAEYQQMYQEKISFLEQHLQKTQGNNAKKLTQKIDNLRKAISN